MTRHPLPPPRDPAAHGPLRRAGKALVGLAALAVLLALLVGVPYGLTRGVGWPLPHHWPSWHETRDTLTGRFTDRILLDTLACLCWLLWAVFVADTIRAAPGAVHDARHTAMRPRPLTRDHRESRWVGPLRGLATALVAAIVSGLLSFRPHPSGPIGPADVRAATPRPAAAASTVRAYAPDTSDAAPGLSTDSATGPRVVTVRPPHDGIHDSLWRIAQRCLGDGARWPEIYHLSHGRPQPDGGTLDRPSLIQPGWVLRLPVTSAENKPEPATRQPPFSPRPSGPHAPSPPVDPERPSTPTDHAAVHATGRSGGVDLGDGVLVGLGLAGTVSAAMLVARRRRRRFYVPGSGRRDDLLPVAPVVRTLHLAHLRDTAPGTGAAAQNGGDLSIGHDDAEPHIEHITVSMRTQPTTVRSTGSGNRRQLDVPAGVAAGQEIAIDLARVHGLGLVGPGAGDATRALLLHLLARDDANGESSGPTIVMPADTAAALQLPEIDRLPTRLTLVPDLAAALDEAETAILRHVRLTSCGGPDSGVSGDLGVVLVTSVPTDTRRLQAIVETGTSTGVGAVLLGQWRPGSSLYVTADGTVTATSPGVATRLRGADLFRLNPADTAELLSALRAADDPPAAVDQAGAAADEAESTNASPPRTTSRREGTQPSPDSTVPINPTPHPSGDDRIAGTPAGSGRTSHQRRTDGGHRFDANTGPAQPPLLLTVLGPVRLTWTPCETVLDRADTGAPAAHTTAARTDLDITGAVSPRLRELLVLLALYPEGITRDRLADTLWPDTSAERPFATLNKTLTRLRRTIATATRGQILDIVRTVGDRHLLDPDTVQTDFHLVSDALAARRAARDDTQRVVAYRNIVAAYRGELAEGLSAEWLETSREAVRRDAVDAATNLARLLVASDARTALDLLETARAFDPYNEAIYHDIMRLQCRLGQPDAIERTLALLATRLGELDETPAPATLALVERLRDPNSTRPAQAAR